MRGADKIRRFKKFNTKKIFLRGVGLSGLVKKARAQAQLPKNKENYYLTNIRAPKLIIQYL